MDWNPLHPVSCYSNGASLFALYPAQSNRDTLQCSPNNPWLFSSSRNTHLFQLQGCYWMVWLLYQAEAAESRTSHGANTKKQTSLFTECIKCPRVRWQKPLTFCKKKNIHQRCRTDCFELCLYGMRLWCFFWVRFSHEGKWWNLGFNLNVTHIITFSSATFVLVWRSAEVYCESVVCFLCLWRDSTHAPNILQRMCEWISCNKNVLIVQFDSCCLTGLTRCFKMNIIPWCYSPVTENCMLA